MPQKAFTIPIRDVVDLLGLEINPRDSAGASSFNVRCPFCDKPGSKKYHMNINTVKNVYFCPRCMDSTTTNCGALDLYGRVRHGTPLIPGGNGRQLYHELMCDLEGRSPNRTFVRELPVDESADILPADNETLDKTYRALLSLPYMTLTQYHGQNLLKRGLDRESIQAGMYASQRKADSLVKKHPDARKAYAWYNTHNIGRCKANTEALRFYTKPEIVAGLLIASDLQKLGVELNRVPGFFKLEGRWCYRYDRGMLIPTVSLDGCVVGMQVRRDVATNSGLRYMTVSSKGLDCGVTTKIARTHVVKTAEICEDTSVFLTEGPLKANVIAHLLSKRSDKPIAVVAVQGVNNTKELPEIAARLFATGIRKAFIALDMDKTGNMSVAQAGRTMKAIFADKGIKLISLCWDKEYAQVKYKDLAALCDAHRIPVPETANIFEDIFTMAHDLYTQGVEYNVYRVNGKEYKDHWRNETKGLDDYLLFSRNDEIV